ncbi:hypothetical protein [Kineosporia sp. A_224]|uniref:hypothetical protein n=1 Tax=Kineosporia sp. A_224 TaxID=1962180 RepID=UPI000B4BB76E|nr:hypothetical protein [Kineosporia sp. A_224]
MTAAAPCAVVWVGGGSGAGKTTLVRAVAGLLDLRAYHVDAYSYDHVRRAADGAFPRTQAFNAMTYDDRWLRAPEVLAEEFLAISAERMPLVVEDLDALGPGATVLAEGPQLLPDLVAPLLGSPDAAVWLLPTESFSRGAVTARAEVVPSAREAEAVENRHRRDVLVTRALRDRADALGLRSVVVDGGRSLTETVDRFVSSLLRVPGGLVRAATGEQRAIMRRQENQVMATQLTLYREDLGVEALPEPPVARFSCECSTLGCVGEVSLTVDAYQRRRVAGPLVVHAT